MVASGIKVSKLDPCLFVGDNVAAVAFVDDIQFWAKDRVYINKFAIKLCSQGLLLEQEDNAARFLGVEMNQTEEGLMEMKHTGLIDQILDALGLDSKMAMNKYMPAKEKLLRHNEDGEGLQGLFSS